MAGRGHGFCALSLYLSRATQRKGRETTLSLSLNTVPSSHFSTLTSIPHMTDGFNLNSINMQNSYGSGRGKDGQGEGGQWKGKSIHLNLTSFRKHLLYQNSIHTIILLLNKCIYPPHPASASIPSGSLPPHPPSLLTPGGLVTGNWSLLSPPLPPSLPAFPFSSSLFPLPAKHACGVKAWWW